MMNLNMNKTLRDYPLSLLYLAVIFWIMLLLEAPR